MHYLPNVKDCEFMALSPQGSAVIVKATDTQVHVLDGDTFDRVFSLKASQAKCVHLANKHIFVG